MANIRVDISHTIYDGSEIIFLSPCDCSQIFGLSIYYPSGENEGLKNQSFVFKDAHGHNLSDIDNLFTANAYVKVILNVTDSVAYIQNADTNKYLEGRFDSLNSYVAKVEKEAEEHIAQKIEELRGDTSYTDLKDIEDDIDNMSKEHQISLEQLYEQLVLYTDGKIAGLINGAPETLDTLDEIASAMLENEDVVKALHEAIGTKASEVEFSSHANNGNIHITPTERTDWNDANSKKHTHGNKSVLDSTTASFTTEEKSKLEGVESGANKYVLPKATQTVLGGVNVDETLSNSSTNPVQNKVIYAELDTLKKSVSDGKTLVANAITDNGVTMATDATFETMANGVNTVATNKYNAGVSATKKGTATQSDVLSGKTFTNANGVDLVGTMQDFSDTQIKITTTEHVNNVQEKYGNDASGYFGYVEIKPKKKGMIDEDTTIDFVMYGVHPEVVKAGALIGANTTFSSSTPPESRTYGTFTSDATATADEILNGETAYVNGDKVIGTMPNNGAVSKTITPSTSSQSYTIPKGFHNGSGKITVNSAPTSLIDGDATAENVLTGKTFFVDSYTKKTGTMPNNGAVSKSLNCGGSYIIPKGYHDGTGKVTVNSLASQTDGDATAEHILADKTAYVDGVKVTGTMTDNGAKTSSLNCGGSYTIPKGYHDGSGKITANSLSSQTNATATASDIASGKTAWVKGSLLTGTLAKFSNGTAWTSSISWGSASKVHYAKGVWVCCHNSTVKYSTDGKTWTASNLTQYIYSLWYADGVWVAGTSSALYYSTDGKSWTICSGTFSSGSFNILHYANGIWIAGNSGGVYYSTNGIDWTTASVTYKPFTLVYYAKGKWYAIGSYTTSGSSTLTVYYLLTSTDGKSWSIQGQLSFSSLCYAEGVFVGTRDSSHTSSEQGLYYSTDGKSWTKSNITVKPISFVYYANGIWIAGNSSGGYLYYSTDGKTWTASTLSASITGILYANGVYVAYGSSGLYYSTDGKSWTKSISSSISCLYCDNGLWVASGSGVYYSVTWKA